MQDNSIGDSWYAFPRCTLIDVLLVELGRKDIFLWRNISLWHLAASIVKKTMANIMWGNVALAKIHSNHSAVVPAPVSMSLGLLLWSRDLRNPKQT